MHLCRGAGLSGLSGIAPVRDMKGAGFDDVEVLSDNRIAEDIRPAALQIIRPLLDTPRTEIEGYLREEVISWRTDETNADTVYTRNAIRQEVLPYLTAHINAQVTHHIAVAAEHLREVSAYLEGQTQRAYDKCVEEDGALNLINLRGEEPFIQTEVLKRAWMEAQVKRKKPLTDAHAQLEQTHAEESNIQTSLTDTTEQLEHTHLESLKNLIAGSLGTVTLDLPAGLMAERRYDKLYFRTPFHFTDKDHCLTMKEVQLPYVNPLTWEVKDAFLSSYTNRLDYDKIDEVLCAEQEELQFRKRAVGDRILIADGRHKSLKKYMIDDKIPECARDALHVLAAGSRILWIPGFYTEPGLMAREDSARVLECRYTRNVHIKKGGRRWRKKKPSKS